MAFLMTVHAAWAYTGVDISQKTKVGQMQGGVSLMEGSIKYEDDAGSEWKNEGNGYGIYLAYGASDMLDLFGAYSLLENQNNVDGTAMSIGARGLLPFDLQFNSFWYAEYVMVDFDDADEDLTELIVGVGARMQTEQLEPYASIETVPYCDYYGTDGSDRSGLIDIKIGAILNMDNFWLKAQAGLFGSEIIVLGAGMSF